MKRWRPFFTAGAATDALILILILIVVWVRIFHLRTVLYF